MPMRIISQGRHAYILAGYLQKRGKWSWQWSERYFVLTSTALHYFKRDRRELYGKERGVFLLEDMEASFLPEKLCIEIKSSQSGITRMLKAPTEREFLTWCRAFEEALGMNGKKAEQYNPDGSTKEGMSLDSLHTIAPSAGPGGKHQRESSASQSYQGASAYPAAAPGSQRGSLKDGLGNHPLYPASATSTPTHGTGRSIPNSSQSMRNLHHNASPTTGTPNTTQPQKGKSGESLAVGPATLSRVKSTPSTTASIHRLAVPTDFPAGMSGYSSGISTSPLVSPSHGNGGTLLSSSGGGKHIGSAFESFPATIVNMTDEMGDTLNKHAVHTLRQHHQHSQPSGTPSREGREEDVLRKYSLAETAPPVLPGMIELHQSRMIELHQSQQRAAGGSPFRQGALPTRENGIALVTVNLAGVVAGGGEGTVAPGSAPSLSPSSSPSPVPIQSRILGSQIPFHSPIILPLFSPGSTMHATLSDRISGGVLTYKSLEQELKAGLREGTKILDVSRSPLPTSPETPTTQNASQKDPRQILLGWKVLSSSSSVGTSESSSSAVVSRVTPAAGSSPFLLLTSQAASLFYFLLLTLVILGMIPAAPYLFMLLGAILACLQLAQGGGAKLKDLRKDGSVAFSSSSSSSSADPSPLTGPITLEITFLSLLDPRGELDLAFTAAASSSRGSSPNKLNGGAGNNNQQSGGGGSASRKKKGILRRRANDLPEETASVSGTIATAPQTASMRLIAHERAGDFELSEYSDSARSETSTRENSRLEGATSGGLSSPRAAKTGSSLHRRGGGPSGVGSGHSSAASSIGGGMTGGISSAGEEEDPGSTPRGPSSSAPPPKALKSSLSNAAATAMHTSPPPVISSVDTAVASASSGGGSALSEDSEFTLVGGSNSTSHSTIASSSGAPPRSNLSRHPSGRSDNSEFGTDGPDGPETFETDVESRGHAASEQRDGGLGLGATDGEDLSHALNPEELEARKAREEQLHQAILDSLHQYSDDPSSSPPVPSSSNENPAPWGAWMEDDVSILKVRGPTFLEDKIKIPVGIPIFKLVHVDMFYTSQENPNLVHVTAREKNWGNLWLQRREQKWKELLSEAGSSSPSLSPSTHPTDLRDPASPLFVMNFLFPGPNNKNMNLVLYFVRRVRPGEEIRKRKELGIMSHAASRRSSKNSMHSSSSTLPHTTVGQGELLRVKSSTHSPLSSPSVSYSSEQIARVCAFDGLLRRFLDGPGGPASHPLPPDLAKALDEFRDCRLKIVPRIAAGPWIVRKGVGCVPAILGKKVQQRYYRDPQKNYIEVVADVSSSMIAGRILALVKGAAQALTIDLSFILQGDTIDELPESLLGGVRILRCNLDALLEIDEHEKWLAGEIKRAETEGKW